MSPMQMVIIKAAFKYVTTLGAYYLCSFYSIKKEFISININASEIHRISIIW